MIRTNPFRSLMAIACLVAVVFVSTAHPQVVSAQAKPEAPAAPVANRPAAPQPPAQPPAAQPPAAKPPAAPAQPAAPQPPAAQPGAQPPATPPPAAPAQPVGAQLPAVPPAPAKSEVGPPNPTAATEAQARGPKTTDIPAPTVQLKPGEVPAVKFDATDYDYGKIPAGQQVSHDYWFTNTGTGPLEILSVKPSCGCTVAGAYDRIVQPGESGKIPVKLNVGNHGGRQSKPINVYTNVPGEGANLKLNIAGEVWTAMDIQPTNASFGRLSMDAAKDPALVQKVVLTSNVEDPVQLTNVKCNNPVFKVETTVIEPGKKFEVQIRFAKPPLSGNNSGLVELATGVKDMPTMSFPVTAFVLPDVEVMPANLSLPLDLPTATSRQLYVKNNGKTPLQLSDAVVSNPSLKAKLEETQPGMAYRLTIDVPAGYQAPDNGDKVTFKTNNPSMPTVSVPVTQLKPAPLPATLGNQAPGAAPAAGAAGAIQIKPTPIQAIQAGKDSMGTKPPAGGTPPAAGTQPPAAPPTPAGTKPPAAPQTPPPAQPPAGGH